MIYHDFVDFYDQNCPMSGAWELLCLYDSVSCLSDEFYYSTKEVVINGKTKFKVTTSRGDSLILTKTSRTKFLSFIASQSKYPDLDLETAVDYENSVENKY